MIQLPWLGPDRSVFPPIDTALDEPDGLLAGGGDLHPERLINAYCRGIFPWYESDQPILWWSPDPRTVIAPNEIHISRSLAKFMAKRPYRLSCDQAFKRVIDACAAPRRVDGGTWITSEMRTAYCDLHRLGIAHSVEVWEGTELVGGLYGLALGQVFFGESMFSRKDNASKIAFAALGQNLEQWGFKLIDCQVASGHLFRMGAREIPREAFRQHLECLARADGRSAWPARAQLQYPRPSGADKAV